MTKKKVCWKLKHKTEPDARKQMMSSICMKGRSRKADRKINTYKCSVCGFWHWGHRPERGHKNKIMGQKRFKF